MLLIDHVGYTARTRKHELLRCTQDRGHVCLEISESSSGNRRSVRDHICLELSRSMITRLRRGNFPRIFYRRGCTYEWHPIFPEASPHSTIVQELCTSSKGRPFFWGGTCFALTLLGNQSRKTSHEKKRDQNYSTGHLRGWLLTGREITYIWCSSYNG